MFTTFILAAVMPLLSTVTVGGVCSVDCPHGQLVLGAGEIVGERPDGMLLVLTARHVVDKLARPSVYLRDARSAGAAFGELWQTHAGRRASVVALAPDTDLALVAFRPRAYDTFAVATLAPSGLPGFGSIVGDPNGALWTTSPFRFLERTDDTFVVECATCGPGDSGGGVFDASGRLAGILIRQRIDPANIVNGEALGTTQFQVVALSKVRAFLANTPAATAVTAGRYGDDPWSRFEAMRHSTL
jgi:hypothetical protein